MERSLHMKCSRAWAWSRSINLKALFWFVLRKICILCTIHTPCAWYQYMMPRIGALQHAKWLGIIAVSSQWPIASCMRGTCSWFIEKDVFLPILFRSYTVGTMNLPDFWAPKYLQNISLSDFFDDAYVWISSEKGNSSDSWTTSLNMCIVLLSYLNELLPFDWMNFTSFEPMNLKIEWICRVMYSERYLEAISFCSA